MKILITNDDGFDHIGHQSLCNILQRQGHEVWSIAPMCNQSGVGMRMSLGKSVRFEQLGPQSWSCSGSPVDCVVFALHGILPIRPDAVISGINAGANLSDDLWYSGTAAAAREASKWGVPALALSYSFFSSDYQAEDFLHFDYLLQRHLENLLAACELETVAPINEKGNEKAVGFLNINIPRACDGEIFLATKFAPRSYVNTLKCIAKNEYKLVGSLNPAAEPAAEVDTWADRNSHASISLGAFQALQPMPYQSVCDGEIPLQATLRAQEAMAQILELGLQ